MSLNRVFNSFNRIIYNSNLNRVKCIKNKINYKNHKKPINNNIIIVPKINYPNLK